MALEDHGVAGSRRWVGRAGDLVVMGARRRGHRREPDGLAADQEDVATVLGQRVRAGSKVDLDAVEDRGGASPDSAGRGASLAREDADDVLLGGRCVS